MLRVFLNCRVKDGFELPVFFLSLPLQIPTWLQVDIGSLIFK